MRHSDRRRPPTAAAAAWTWLLVASTTGAYAETDAFTKGTRRPSVPVRGKPGRQRSTADDTAVDTCATGADHSMPAFQDQGQRRRLAGGRASFSSATTKSASDRLANFGRDGHGGGASESFDEDDDSCEDYDTEDGVGLESEEDLEDHDGSDFGAALVFSPDGYQDSSDSEADDDYKDSTTDPGTDDIEDGYASEELVDAASLDSLGSIASPGSRLPEANSSGDDDSVEVCVVTWNLAEETPPARDLEFLRHAAAGSDLVAVGVQEIENLKPRRNEGGRTREWRRLLIRTLGRDFVRIGHHAMGAVQLTLFARRRVLQRVKVIKLTDVACGVGNVLHNKGGVGAYVRVDRTTFLFVAAHLAAHQGKLEERNAGYWRIVTTLDQEIPPAWVTHAARKRSKRAKAVAAAAVAAAAENPGTEVDPTRAPFGGGVALQPRGPFEDRVDRVFFFGDLNYRVDLSREDLELGVSVGRREEGGAKEQGRRTGLGGRLRPGSTYPGTGVLDALLDFDQLTLARSRGDAFEGFSEARVAFEPTYKYDKGAESFDTSRKMRAPAWTDRILHCPGGPLGVSSLEYSSVPGSCHSDHRPVYATFRVRLAN